MDKSSIPSLKKLIIKKVSIYCDKLGLIIDPDELNKHIYLSKNEIDSIIKKKTIKPRIIFKVYTDYNKFIDICDSNKINYFNYYDEHDWNGPAVKCDHSSLNTYKKYFKNLSITILEGTLFYIIHPKNKCKDTINYHNSKLNTKDSFIPDNSDNECYSGDSEDSEDSGNSGDNGDNDEDNRDSEDSDEDNGDSDEDNGDNGDSDEDNRDSDSEHSSDSEEDNRDSDSEHSSDSDIEIEEWIFKKTKYLLDAKNNVYTYETNEFIGVKIDEYTLDFDSDEIKN
jgi:hypothetical protein